MTVRRTVILTSGTTWRVPNTWNNLYNSVICIGGGAGGSFIAANGWGGSGGGGGGYSESANLTLTPNSTISILIGAGGASNTNGGYTSFNSNTVQAQGGRSNTKLTGAWTHGGVGGQASDGVGTIKFSGGAGGNGSTVISVGGGGGGAGGNTAAGSMGANSTATTGGDGGAAGATDGGNGGAGGNGDDGGRGFHGWPWPSTNTFYGNNFAGGGGGGADVIPGEVAVPAAAGVGGGFGGGGGGQVGGGGGTGGNGAIIITWNYESRLPPSGAYSLGSNVAVALDRTPNTTINMNDGVVRDLFRSGGAGAISFSTGAGKVANGAVVATNNSTGVSSNIPLPSGWQTGDLAVLFIINGAGTGANAFVTTEGWTYLGPNTRTISALNYTTGAFSRILQSGDSNSGPIINQSSGGAYIITFRNASRATAIARNVATGTTLTFPTVSKDSDSKKLLSFLVDRNPASDATAPSGWTEHTRAVLSFFSLECASVNSATHTDGTNITWTGAETTYQNQGILIEIT